MTELPEVRRFHRQNIHLSPIKTRLVNSLDTALFRLEIKEHENKRLVNAIVQEKKRRKRGKPLGMPEICPPEFKGRAQVFTPSKIGLARARLDELEEIKRQELICKEAAKAQKKVIQIEKKFAIEERKREAAERKAKRAEEAALKKQLQEVQKLQRLAEKQAQQQAKTQKRQSKPVVVRKKKESVMNEMPEVLKRDASGQVGLGQAPTCPQEGDVFWIGRTGK